MRPLTPTLLACAALLAACSTPRPAPVACEQLPTALAALPGVRLSSAAEQPAEGRTPAQCVVSGVANERTGADGQTYGTRFEMRLPEGWRRGFVHQVNGGNDGRVLPALGALGVLQVNALQRGFAVISSDSGHNEDDPAIRQAGLVKGVLFGLDAQARRDYGYSADDTMYQVAQRLMQQRYGEAPQRNYMVGCSNGGRHALVAATRYGQRYDGILAGAPGLNLPKAAVQHAWDVQSWQLAHADIRQAFSADDMKLVGAKVLERCDALDGLADGIVHDLAACQRAFSPAVLQCSGAKTPQCLTAPQVTALTRSLAGPRNSRGEALYSDWSWDAGMSAGNWRFWKLESTIPPWDRLPLIATMGAGSLSHVFSTPPTPTAGTPAALLAFLTRFDFDRDAPKIFARSAAFPESAMEFMAPPDVDNPQLSGFRAHGGKLIVYHGNSDAVFSVNDTHRWFERLQANSRGEDFARFYPVPGMAHCNGGPATDQVDVLGALVDWVEQGRAPGALLASTSPANRDLPADWSKQRTRPLCPHPQVARYTSGDPESAASFRCVAP